MEARKEGRIDGRQEERMDGRKEERMDGEKEERKKQRKKKRKKGEKESTRIWEGVKTTPPGSEEPVNIFLKKQLDADSAALSRK